MVCKVEGWVPSSLRKEGAYRSAPGEAGLGTIDD